MNLGLLPVTGLPLPFLSYGGSSMFASWLAVGLVNATPQTAAAFRVQRPLPSGSRACDRIRPPGPH